MRFISISIVFILICFSSCNKGKMNSVTVEDYTRLKQGFENPPDSTKPGIYWYFISGHISKEGITKDLEAMKRVGIGEVFIGDIFFQPSTRNPFGLSYDTPLGNTPSLSKKWWDCMRHAISEGNRLGINISFFNSPGWSQSGGPWVKEDQAMMYLTYSDTVVSGGSDLLVKLSKPKQFFQDVSVLAYPVDNVEKMDAKIIVLNCNASSTDNLLDQDKSTVCTFDNKRNEPVILEVSFDKPVTVRSLTISPTKMHFSANVEVETPENGNYKSVKKCFFDRGHSKLSLGPLPDGDMIVSLDNINSKTFRIIISDVPENFELTGIAFSEDYKIGHATEKWLEKLPHSSVPSWELYQWNTPKYSSMDGVLKTNDVINLTENFDGNELEWKNVPVGQWKILRIGMTTTGITNAPANPTARGLEIDKLSRKALRSHFNAYMGEFIKSMTPDERKSLKRVIADSYETGPQNWTDDMHDSFEKAYGYDPSPWLITLTGVVLNSAEESDRFLWDLRRLVADKVADEYVGGLREICEEYGITMWLENYGHWGFPSEFLKYGGRSHEIGGEFWITHQNIECRLAASASHIYGKNRVYAESYTSSEIPYSVYPSLLKQSGDWSYTEGINQGILHVYIHQPYTDKFPGVNAWFGTEFNRNNTWFEQSKEWIKYLRRNYFLLQQGKHVADVCFFIGEDTPKMNGWVDPVLSKGYEYDFINAEIITERLEVKDGRLVLPGGANYGALVLPPLNTMRPGLLSKLQQLAEQGATIIGMPPEKSPSLQNYPFCDELVKQLVEDLWGEKSLSSNGIIHNKIGKGNVYCNGNINDILESHGIYEDLIIPDSMDIKWEHRKLNGMDIYFLTNQGNNQVSFNASFRVSGIKPELWNALDGNSYALPEYSNEDGRTIVPLNFNVNESYFIVFHPKGIKRKENLSVFSSFKSRKPLKEINSLWDIQFNNDWLGTNFTLKKQQLFDWTTSSNDSIRYFSGTATYKTSFDLTQEELSDSVYINFEHLNIIATVKLNGVELGTIWTTPYSILISEAAKSGSNLLEVDVTNNWTNQLLWQYMKEPEKRETWELVNVLGKRPDVNLMPSGLSGKVWLSVNN